MGGLFKRWWKVGMLGLLWLGVVAAVPACPFCTMQGQTLTGELAQANMVLFGTIVEANPNPTNEAPEGTVDLAIETVIKKHDILNGKKVITLPRYVPKDKDTKWLVFCDIFKDKIDPYRGVAVKADSDMAKYLKGAMDLPADNMEKRLRFFFDFLDNHDIEISNDAYKEFANIDYKDFKVVAGSLPADKVARWLKDKNTASFRFGLYASMLGHSGKAEHADLLREMLDDPAIRVGSGVDGLLAGYTMLKPKEGLAYLKSILGEPTKEFLFRYSALKTVRFFWDYRTDVISHKDLIEAVLPLLQQKDIADLLIDDFRKWQCWDLTDRILSLQNYPVYNTPVIKRSIIKFALSSKQSEAAQRYIEELRAKEPKLVNDVEELLKLDVAPLPAK
jgi:hypothetical protein